MSLDEPHGLGTERASAPTLRDSILPSPSTRAIGSLAPLFRPEREDFSAPLAATAARSPATPSLLAPARLVMHYLPRVIVVLTLVWGLCFNFSEVRGSSMEPGIHDQDRIVVDHVTYLLAPVQRGDIVILRYPLDPSVDYIKRVIGLPGDEILMADGKLWVNGELLREDYLDRQSIDPYSRVRVTVEPRHYYVLGDNRMRSSDSREFGQVPDELLRGKVQACIWPLSRLRWIR